MKYSLNHRSVTSSNSLISWDESSPTLLKLSEIPVIRVLTLLPAIVGLGLGSIVGFTVGFSVVSKVVGFSVFGLVGLLEGEREGLFDGEKVVVAILGEGDGLLVSVALVGASEARTVCDGTKDGTGLR